MITRFEIFQQKYITIIVDIQQGKFVFIDCNR